MIQARLHRHRPPLLRARSGLFVSAALIPRLSVGLDQAVALPRDSYMQAYYRWGWGWVGLRGGAR